MTGCIGPAAHAFALAIIWIWPPGAEHAKPQDIHVHVVGYLHIQYRYETSFRGTWVPFIYEYFQ